MKINDIRKGPAFGMKLTALGESRGYLSARDFAVALYENGYCFELVHPRDRTVKYETTKKKDIDSIARRVQDHIKPTVEAQDVPGNYMYAYSLLFDCSLDYLYGRIEEPSPDAEITDISQKTGLSAKVVTNLIDNYDPDPDVFSMTRIWSEVLESGLFEEVPTQWFIYCGNKLRKADLEKKIEAIRKAEPEAGDDDYRTMMEIRRNALKGLEPMLAGNCQGAFAILSHTLATYIESRTDEWLNEQHEDFEDNYYDNEIRKIEAIEAALKEGSEPVKKHSVRGKGTE